VRISNLTVEGYRESGVVFRGVPGGVVEGVRAVGNRVHGVAYLGGAGRGQVRNTLVSGAGEAGVAVRGCADCDLVLDNVTATQNTAGYWGTNAGGVSITRSTFSGNATGIVLASSPQDGTPPQSGTHVWASTISDNNLTGLAPTGAAATASAPSGVGVWIAGGWLDTIQGNTVTGHDRYGVVASWLFTPAVGNRVLDNVVGGSGKADLAWDGLGVGTCFSGNGTPEGGSPSSSPPDAQTLYDCSAPGTVGVPLPTITAELLAASARPVWCRPQAGELCDPLG